MEMVPISQLKKVERKQKSFAELLEWYESGELKPHISYTFIIISRPVSNDFTPPVA